MRVFILILQVLIFASAATSLSPDGWALLHFRSNIEEDPKQALSNWNAYDQDPCSWFGVSCMYGKVISMNLSGLSLKGRLGPELGQLVNLQKLILRGNDFTGPIPTQIGELAKLEVLDLAHNHLSGHIPGDLGNLSSLSRLYLENNNLEGVIPAELGELKNLCELIITVNKFTGSIPEGLTTETENHSFHHGNTFDTRVCEVKYLRVADFSSNYFEGDLPACLQHLPSACFSFNCLSQGLLHQRPIEDCSSKKLSSIVWRRLLQSDGSAGVNGTVNKNESTPFTISNVSPAPVEAPAPVEVSSKELFNSFPAPSSPVPSSEVGPSPSAVPSSSSLNIPTSPLFESSSPSHSSKIIVVIVSASVVACLVIAGVVILLCFRHRKSTAVWPWKGSMSGELQKGVTKGVPAFSRAELEAACEDFSNIIGFSPDIVLFKGTLANGVEIAVTSIRKSAKSWSTNSELIFWRKVESLSQMKHQNLLNLLGYCAEEEPFIRMLVFEYVPNGTVHEHLHNRESEHLDWETRMRIIMGVAYALDYMHHGFDSLVTHTKPDTKSVFLSEDFSAKLADFGVWKASKQEKDSKDANALGNDDLELSDRLKPHLETNIYDFGLLLLEMVSGRPPHSKEFGSLVEWALSYIRSPGQVACIVDPTLESYDLKELEVVTSVAYDCLQPDSSSLLTMKQICSSLSSSLSSVNEPIIPRSSPLLWAELQILSQD